MTRCNLIPVDKPQWVHTAKGTTKREGDLKEGDIVQRMDPVNPYCTMTVLFHNREKRLIKYARPYSGNIDYLGDETMSKMFVACETFTGGYPEKTEHQGWYVVIGQDTHAIRDMQAYKHAFDDTIVGTYRSDNGITFYVHKQDTTGSFYRVTWDENPDYFLPRDGVASHVFNHYPTREEVLKNFLFR